MTTKAEIINGAFRQLRISGLTVNPRPTHTAEAVVDLDRMMATFLEGRNLHVDYNFEETPDLNSVTNVRRTFEDMMIKQLAVRLVPPFNKEVPVKLLQLAGQAFEDALKVVARYTLQQVQNPIRMPRGSGNTVMNPSWQRYSYPIAMAPNTGSTVYITVGETLTFEESFSAWLGTNTISSYTIELDPRLTKNSDSQSGGVITYSVTASTSQGYPPLQFVKMTVTDSAGRVLIRLISFQVEDTPTVGS